MRFFLSYPLTSSTPSYGNRDLFSESINSEIINNNGANTSKLNFSNNHIGTHIDTPFHFFNNGKKVLDYEADDFCFLNIHIIFKPMLKGELINMNDEELNAIPVKTEFLILKTDYCYLRTDKKYIFDNPGLHKDLAYKLRNSLPNLRAVGFDFISLTSWNFRQHGRESHKSFLGPGGDFIIVEDMDLTELNPETKLKSIILAPLRTISGNGGPVTIIAEL